MYIFHPIHTHWDHKSQVISSLLQYKKKASRAVYWLFTQTVHKHIMIFDVKLANLKSILNIFIVCCFFRSFFFNIFSFLMGISAGQQLVFGLCAVFFAFFWIVIACKKINLPVTVATARVWKKGWKRTEPFWRTETMRECIIACTLCMGFNI